MNKAAGLKQGQPRIDSIFRFHAKGFSTTHDLIHEDLGPYASWQYIIYYQVSSQLGTPEIMPLMPHPSDQRGTTQEEKSELVGKLKGLDHIENAIKSQMIYHEWYVWFDLKSSTKVDTGTGTISWYLITKKTAHIGYVNKNEPIHFLPHIKHHKSFQILLKPDTQISDTVYQLLIDRYLDIDSDTDTDTDNLRYWCWMWNSTGTKQLN